VLITCLKREDQGRWSRGGRRAAWSGSRHDGCPALARGIETRSARSGGKKGMGSSSVFQSDLVENCEGED